MNVLITACSPTLLALGKHCEAQLLLRESLRLSYATRDSGGAARTLHNLGLVAFHQGDTAEAIYFLREAIPSLRSASSLVSAHALNDLGAALWQSGARDEAQRSYAEALEIALRVHTQAEALHAIGGLAACHAASGRYASALGLAARALADPAASPELRGAMAELHERARAQLPADEAAQIEARAGGLPLARLLSELTG